MGTRFPWNDATFGHLLQCYRTTYHLPETPEDIEWKLLRIMEHGDRLIPQARLDEHKILASLDDEDQKQRNLALAQEG